MRIGYRYNDVPYTGKGHPRMKNGKYNIYPKDTVYHIIESYSYSPKIQCSLGGPRYDAYGYPNYGARRRAYATTGHFSGTVPNDWSPYRTKDLEPPKEALPNTTEEALKVLAGKRRKRMRFPKWVKEPWAKPCSKCFPIPQAARKTIGRPFWVATINGKEMSFDSKPKFTKQIKRVKNPKYNPKWELEYDKTY